MTARSAMAAQAVAVAMLAPALARLRLTSLHRLVEAWARRAPRRGVPAAVVARHVDAAMRAARRRGCLVRGITLYALLRRAGADAALVFGFDRRARSGHCWVELAGEPAFERTDPSARFAPVVRLSRAGVAPP